MAIKNVVDFLKAEIQREAPKYKSLRAGQHGSMDTDVIFEKAWVVDAMVYTLRDAHHKQEARGADPGYSTEMTWNDKQISFARVIANRVYDKLMKKQWVKIHAEQEIGGIAPNQVFNGMSGWEKYEKNQMSAGAKTVSGVIITQKAGNIILTFKNSYRFTKKPGTTTNEYVNNTSRLANVLVKRLSQELLKEIKKKNPKGSIKNLPAGPSSAGESPWQHHQSDGTSGTVAETNFLGFLAQNTKLPSGTVSGQSKYSTISTTAQTAVEDELVAEFSALTRDHKTGKLISKIDKVTVKVGSPGKRVGDVDSAEIDQLLDKIYANLLQQYSGNKAFKTSPKSPLQNLDEVATAEAILKTTAKLRKTRNKNIKTKLNKKVTSYKKHNIKQQKIDAVGLLAAKKGAKLLKKYVGKKVSPTKAMKSRVQGKAGTSPLALKSLLNILLPRAVASKMIGGKTLAFRTGRFASSAEVTNVTAGARGGMNIDYTYMKYPYQTFEPGFAQGSTFRDPRLLIGQSVRELATQIMKEKFTGGVRRI
jgi:hypothetical protein